MNTSRMVPHKILWAAALLIAGAAAWPLLAEAGLLSTRGGGDSPFLLQRVHQLVTAVSDAHFPVRWMPDANYGYGYPFYNYYAPLAFYVAGLFYALGFGLLRAVQLSQLAAFLVAAGGMFALGKRWFGSGWVALFVSAAYTLAPFHLVNVYVRGDSIAEFWAMAFYPLIFLAIEQAASWPASPRPLRATLWAGVPLALAYAGLVLSHNISALIFSPFVLAYALVRWGNVARRNDFSRFSWLKTTKVVTTSGLPFITAGLLGLALSAWFWMPALGEQNLTQVDNTLADYFRYDNHFRTAVTLSQSSFFFDFGVEQLQAFRLGLVQALFIGGGVIAALRQLFRPQAQTAQPLFLLVALALSLLMITPLSQPVWDNVPLLPFVQFPWRFLGLVAFFGAGVMGYALLELIRWGEKIELNDQRREGMRGVTTAVFILLLALSSFGQFQADYLYLTDADITAERLMLYEWFAGNIGTTVGAEYLTPAVAPRAYSSAWGQQGNRWAAWVPEGTAVVEPPLIARTGHQVWPIEVRSDTAVVVLPLLHWPGWSAQLGPGQPVPLTAVASSGLTQLTLPQGEHLVTLRLGRTAVQRAAESISLAALLMVIGLWGISGASQRVWQNPRPWAILLTLFLLSLLIFLLPLRRQQSFPTGMQTMDFAQMPYLHHAPQGVPYENGAHLAGYVLAQTEVSAGESVTLTLDWSAVPAGEPLMAEVVLTHAATHFYNYVPPITAVSQPLTTTGQVLYELPIPPHAPPGLYFPQILLSDKSQPQTATGAQRAPLALMPLRITAVSAPLVDDGLGLAVRVNEVHHRPSAPQVIEVQLAWHTAVDIPQHLQLSLRLTDLQGAPFHATHFDLQPGYGQQATTSWQPGQWRDDWLGLYLPPPAARVISPPYVLLVTLYDVTSNEVWLMRRLGELHPQAANGDLLQFQPHQPTFDLPAHDTGFIPLEATFGDSSPLIHLRGYQLMPAGEQLRLTLFWQAGQDGPIPYDYHRFVHLLDPATGQPVAQHDAMPRHNSYPTSQWVAGEIVADELHLDIASLAAGTYQLTTGLYRIIPPDGYPRLPAFQPDGTPWPDAAVLLQDLR